jgi:iron complex transport system substrate-binding protein
VRKRRLKTVPADLVTRAGPRVAEGLEAVARALHPDAFR